MIYLLEDDESIRKLVVYALESQGYAARGFSEPGEFRQAMDEELPDLLLLDIMLPGEDGMNILRRLRLDAATRHLPVIMLTARNTEYDRVAGLDAGADDYISKPFGMMELVARVRALLRRCEPHDTAGSYCCGPLCVYPEKHEVTVEGRPVTLTHKEFTLLCLLVENSGLVMTRDVLLDRVWGIGTERENRTLDVHIRTLRAKLGEAGSMISTIRGVGYRFTGEAT